MFTNSYIFSQVTGSIPKYDFQKLVVRYDGEYWIKHFTCWEQLLVMMFGQLSQANSLTEVVLDLHAHRKKLYHLGFRNTFALTTVTRANEKRDWRIFRDLAIILIHKARKLYTDYDELELDLEGTVYALDATVIDLCLSIFRWAKFRKTKAAIKVHTLIDLKGNIPSFFWITTGKVHDVNVLDVLQLEEGAYYVMDRGYLDYARLYRIHIEKAFFITRAKSNSQFRRLYSRKINKSFGIRHDQIGVFCTYQAKKDYPDKIRRIKYYCEDDKKYYVYFTNNFDLDAEIIVKLYKYRWQIELFFKWIKGHLEVEVFWGHSINAVKIQLCIAMITYLQIAILKKELKIEKNIYEILQILKVSLFCKDPIKSLVSGFDLQIFQGASSKQASLFEN